MTSAPRIIASILDKGELPSAKREPLTRPVQLIVGGLILVVIVLAVLGRH